MPTLRVDLRIGDIIGALLFLALAVFGVWRTMTWLPPVMPGDPGAAFFPRFALGVIAIFAAMLLARRLASRRASQGAAGEDTVSIDLAAVAVAAGAGVLLTLALEMIGTEVAVFVYLLVMLGWRTGRWTTSAIAALVSALVVWFVFVIVLKVHLPLAVLPRYIAGF